MNHIPLALAAILTLFNLWAMYQINGLMGKILRLTNEFKAGLDRLQ